MFKSGIAGGHWISLTARLDGDGSPVVVVRLVLGWRMVDDIAITYPMKTLDSAKRFVSGADQATFERVIEQMAPHVEDAKAFAIGMSKGLKEATGAKRDQSKLQPSRRRA